MEPGKDSKLKQQIANLRSSNRSAILETLKELRKAGDVSVLPELFNLLLIQDDGEIQAEIISLLNDLKDREAAEILSSAISNPEFEQIRTSLISACWQCGLSFGKHIPVFVDAFVSGSYPAAIEAFTVIEEAVGELEQKDREKVIRSLKSSSTKVDDQKKTLLAELISVIESYQEPTP
jgi:hypothetical protein